MSGMVRPQITPSKTTTTATTTATSSLSVGGMNDSPSPSPSSFLSYTNGRSLSSGSLRPTSSHPHPHSHPQHQNINQQQGHSQHQHQSQDNHQQLLGGRGGGGGNIDTDVEEPLFSSPFFQPIVMSSLHDESHHPRHASSSSSVRGRFDHHDHRNGHGRLIGTVFSNLPVSEYNTVGNEWFNFYHYLLYYYLPLP